ncbi:hypothetical protein ACGFK1_29315, partial [Mycobacterium sp. NPDC048908]|uniref:hypothetical protein n=1 Tax=Mycobacterium sp. NPDC048908 TaxID=3364292 RepID=UPI0037160955
PASSANSANNTSRRSLVLLTTDGAAVEDMTPSSPPRETPTRFTSPTTNNLWMNSRLRVTGARCKVVVVAPADFVAESRAI